MKAPVHVAMEPTGGSVSFKGKPIDLYEQWIPFNGQQGQHRKTCRFPLGAMPNLSQHLHTEDEEDSHLNFRAVVTDLLLWEVHQWHQESLPEPRRKL